MGISLHGWETDVVLLQLLCCIHRAVLSWVWLWQGSFVGLLLFAAASCCLLRAVMSRVWLWQGSFVGLLLFAAAYMRFSLCSLLSFLCGFCWVFKVFCCWSFCVCLCWLASSVFFWLAPAWVAFFGFVFGCSIACVSLYPLALALFYIYDAVQKKN